MEYTCKCTRHECFFLCIIVLLLWNVESQKVFARNVYYGEEEYYPDYPDYYSYDNDNRVENYVEPGSSRQANNGGGGGGGQPSEGLLGILGVLNALNNLAGGGGGGPFQQFTNFTNNLFSPTRWCRIDYAVCFTIFYGARKCCVGLLCPITSTLKCEANERRRRRREISSFWSSWFLEKYSATETD